jgi:hypothetical protein
MAKWRFLTDVFTVCKANQHTILFKRDDLHLKTAIQSNYVARVFLENGIHSDRV